MMNETQFRDKIYKILSKSKKLKWVSMTFEEGNEQCILVEMSDGSKFQIVVVRTERKI